jgi:hypothetical protein
MPPSPRYAIYLAPPPHDPLWAFGSAVLGYDAATGEDVEGFFFDGFGPEDWRSRCAAARVYGFHATLKAPFRLRPGCSPAQLVAAIERLAATQSVVAVGPLTLSSLGESGGFLALTPVQPPPELAALERIVVTELDAFRAALTEQDIARRRPDDLTPRQRDHLMRYGYPYVFEDFRLHFTLSDRLVETASALIHLGQTMAGRIGAPTFTADALVLFEQPSAGARFRIMRRFPFGDRR